MFSILRAIGELFGAGADDHLGLYGAFGYDLVFQFEPMMLRLPHADQRDLVLYLPDELLVVDNMRQVATLRRYDFTVGARSMVGLPRSGADDPYETGIGCDVPAESDHAPGEYAAMVERAREAFVRGDLFEVVLGQLLSASCGDQPSQVFERIHAHRGAMPKDLVVTAETADGVVMAIEHASMPMAAVQFHPESVMTAPDIGLRLIAALGTPSASGITA